MEQTHILDTTVERLYSYINQFATWLRWQGRA